MAEDLYFNLLQKSKRGLSLSSKQFHLVAQSFLKDLTEKVERELDLPSIQQRYKPTC